MRAYAHIYGNITAPNLIILVGNNIEDGMTRYKMFCEGSNLHHMIASHLQMFDVSPWILKHIDIIKTLEPDQKKRPISVYAAFWTNLVYTGVLIAPAGTEKHARNALIDEGSDINVSPKWIKDSVDISDNLSRIKHKLIDITADDLVTNDPGGNLQHSA